MIGIIIALICLANAAKTFKEPKRNKFCSILFIVFCFIWMTSKAGGQLIIKYIPYDFNLVSLYLVLLMIVYGACFVLGIFAIFKHDEKIYDSGKSQAVTVVLLSLIFGAVQFARYNKIQNELSAIVEQADEKIEIVNSEHNYSFVLPNETNYKRLKQVNEMMKEADFILKHDNNSYFFMVLSQKIGMDTELETNDFYEMVRENLRTSKKNYKEIAINNTLMNGIPVKEHIYSIKINKINFLYHSYALVHNGIYYQLTTYTMSSAKPEQLKVETQKLSKSFKFIDENKKFYTSENSPLSKFDSEISPYSIDLSESSNWFKWDDLLTECPESEFGGRSADSNVSFCTSSLKIDTSTYSQETLTNAMIRDFNYSLDDKDVTLVKKNTDGILPYYTVKAKTEVDSENYLYAFRVYFAENSVFRLAVWGKEDNEFTDKAFDNLLQNLKILPEESTSEKTLPENLIDQQAELWNYLGVILYNNKKYEESIKCYLKAYEFNKNKNVAVTNYFLALGNLEKHAEVISFLDDKAYLLSDPNVLSWLAFAQKVTGELDAASDNYFLLFTEHLNYSNDEDFIDYLEILSEKEKFETISEITKVYFKKDREQNLYHDLINLLIRNEQLTQAQEQINALPENYKNTIETKRLLLKFLIASGDFKQADKSFQSILEEGYRDQVTLYEGAKLYYEIGWYNKAKSTLTELLKISPNHKKAKELMDNTLSYLGEGDKGNTTQEIAAVPLPADVSNKINSSSSEELSGDVSYDYSITAYSYKNKELKKTIYRKFKLNTAKAVKDSSTLYYTYTPTSSDLYVNELKVTSPDGSSVIASDRNSFYLTEADEDQASEDKTLCMPVSALEPGCTVEYTLTENFNSLYSFFPFKRFWLTMTVPSKYRAVTIEGEVDQIAYSLINSKNKVLKGENYLVFEEPKPVVYKSESESVDSEKIYPIVYIGNNTQSWESEMKDYYDKIKKKLVPSPALTSLVKSLTSDIENRKDKIKTLIDYVQKNITYKAIEFGTRGIIPDLPEKVLKQKYGDCKDMSVLLYQMLKVIGVKSNLTLVSSDYSLIKSIPDFDQFNHMILYIEELDKFVDCTVSHADLLSVGNVYNYDDEVILLDSNKVTIKKIPYDSYTENNVQVDRKIKISGSDLIITEKLTLKNYYAYFLRDSLHQRDEDGKKERLKRFINYWDNVTDFECKMTNLNEFDKDFIIDLNFTVKNAVKDLNNELRLDLIPTTLRYYYSVSESKDRFSPLAIYYDLNMVSKTYVELEEGKKLSFKNTSKSFSEPYAQGKLKADKSSKGINIEIDVKLVKGDYPAKDYQKYYETFEDFINHSHIHLGINN